MSAPLKAITLFASVQICAFSVSAQGVIANDAAILPLLGSGQYLTLTNSINPGQGRMPCPAWRTRAALASSLSWFWSFRPSAPARCGWPLAENSTPLWSHQSIPRSDETWLPEWSGKLGGVERCAVRSRGCLGQASFSAYGVSRALQGQTRHQAGGTPANYRRRTEPRTENLLSTVLALGRQSGRHRQLEGRGRGLEDQHRELYPPKDRRAGCRPFGHRSLDPLKRPASGRIPVSVSSRSSSRRPRDGVFFALPSTWHQRRNASQLSLRLGRKSQNRRNAGTVCDGKLGTQQQGRASRLRQTRLGENSVAGGIRGTHGA